MIDPEIVSRLGGTPPRNVLFVTADQWRGDTLGAVGHPVVQTPVLDRLAAEGTLFARHYGQATPCGPARTSLLTGLYLHSHRSVNNGTPLDLRHTNIARELRKAGYDPTLVGYTDTGDDPRALEGLDPRLHAYGTLPGMSVHLLMRGSRDYWREWLRSQGYDPALTRFPEVFRPDPAAAEAATHPGLAPARFAAEHSDAAYTTERALEWLRMFGDKPWMLHVTYLPPHPPWIAPAPYNTMYDPADVPMPVRPATPEDAAIDPLTAEYLRREAWFSHLDGPARPVATADEAEIRAARAVYYGLCTMIDGEVGRLLAHLDATGQRERTLVVFTSDHGEHLGDGYRCGKVGYRDEGYHIPLIVSAPGLGAGHVDAYTEAVDVMPTILDWLGLPIPEACDGRSLLAFLEGARPEDWRDAAHWAYDFRNLRDPQLGRALGLRPDRCNLAVLRDAQFEYVHFADLPPLLFDLEEDPGRFRNLAEDAGHARTRADYAGRLLSFRMRHEDRTLANALTGHDAFLRYAGPR